LIDSREDPGEQDSSFRQENEDKKGSDQRSREKGDPPPLISVQARRRDVGCDRRGMHKGWQGNIIVISVVEKGTKYSSKFIYKALRG